MRPRGTGTGSGAFDGRHLDRAAESRGRERDRHPTKDMRAVALKDLVRRNADKDVEIARTGPCGPTSPSPARRMRVPSSTPGGMFTDSVFSRRTLPLPAAGFARVFDRLARTLAGRTGPLDREENLVARAPCRVPGRCGTAADATRAPRRCPCTYRNGQRC